LGVITQNLRPKKWEWVITRLPLQHHHVSDQNSSNSRCPASFSLSLDTVSTVNAIRLVYRRKMGDASFMGDMLKLIW
jgi:hypothetical protein